VPTFPAGSATVAVTVTIPSARAAIGVTLQVPSAPATVLMVLVPTLTETRVPAEASVWPETVGMERFVLAVAPPVMVRVGAVVSTVRVCEVDPVLPARSATLMTAFTVPSSTAVGRTTFHVRAVVTLVVVV